MPRARRDGDNDPMDEGDLDTGKLNRSAYHRSMGSVYNEGRPDMGMIMMFIQMDPSINTGSTQGKILDMAAARKAHSIRLPLNAHSRQRNTYGRGDGAGSGIYSPARDPHRSLYPYRAKKHPAFAATRESVANMTADVSFLTATEAWRNAAIHSTSAFDRSADIHPDEKWGRHY